MTDYSFGDVLLVPFPFTDIKRLGKLAKKDEQALREALQKILG